MTEEIKEVAISVSDYSKTKFKRTRVITLVLLIFGLLTLMTYFILLTADINGNHILDFFKGFLLGVTLGSIIIAILYITGLYDRYAALFCKKNKNK